MRTSLDWLCFRLALLLPVRPDWMRRFGWYQTIWHRAWRFADPAPEETDEQEREA